MSNSNPKRRTKRPPPVDTADFPASLSGNLNMLFPIQQQPIVSFPAQANWDLAEQRELDRLARGMSPADSLLSRSLRISAFLPSKNAREVAMRLKMMQESAKPTSTDSSAGFPPPPNEMDMNQDRMDRILLELNVLGRDNKPRALELIQEFTRLATGCKQGLDALNARIPTSLINLEAPHPEAQQQPQ
ncbi:hypothetical protein BASA81_000125 [Batrachochytrium salamandrivorans]|nr:hypothetical protein BASA81_000125 [Batrachochytrium salamandrivorans]